VGAAVAAVKLLIAADDFFDSSPGGGARVPWELARRMAARGNAVTLLAGTREPSAPAGERDGVRLLLFHRQPGRPAASFARALRAAHRAGPADILHLHQPFSGAAALAAGPAAPALYFHHSSWPEEFMIRRRFHRRATWADKGMAAFLGTWERFVLRRSAQAVTLSVFMRDRLLGVHPRLIARVIPGGVDPERFRPAEGADRAKARLRLGWPQDALVFFTARNLEPRMGIENLLAAFAPVADRHPRLHLFIGGEGSLRASLEAQVSGLRLGNRARLLGRLKEQDLLLAYQAADLFVLPTCALEGFGLATVEALATGCPVLGTPVGGTVEVLKGFDPAFLTEDASIDAIRRGMEMFLRREEEWPSLRAEAARHGALFTWERMAEGVEKLSGEMLR
jgi:glycosyltransferase involved in cell wall biosynthesis